MATIRRFEDLNVWQKARDLSKVIYLKSIKGSYSKDFALKDQINAASGSVMDNIAEGFERDGRLEFIQFLSYSKGSAGEVRSQLFRAYDHHHITDSELAELSDKAEELSQDVGRLHDIFKESKDKGNQYNVSEPDTSYTSDLTEETTVNLKSET